MADLCTAFHRIVPRYQFSTNQAAFIVEDMGDAPKRREMCGWNGPSPCSDRRFQCANGLQNRPYGMYVHRKCNWQSNGKFCTTMDTCGNVKDKMSYFYNL